MDISLRQILNITKKLQDNIDNTILPPQEIPILKIDGIIPHTMFKDTRGYLEKIVQQINVSYNNSAYDACAVMIRRLIEVLIIETFDNYNMADEIKNSDGEFYYLDDLIAKTLSQSSWSIGRNSKRGLKNLKKIGDQSAHSRRYNARRKYIDDIAVDLRTVCEEFLYLSNLKK